MSDTLRPQGLWHAWLLCLPLSPGVCSDLCSLSLWCCLTISSSASLFSFCLQFSSVSGSLPVGFVNESVLHIRRPKYWSFSFSNSPSSEYSGLISFRKLNSWATIQRSNSFFFLRLKKIFIEFVTVLLLFYVLDFWPWGMWDLRSLTRDWISIGRQNLNHWNTRKVPRLDDILTVFLNHGCTLEPLKLWGNSKGWALLQTKWTRISSRRGPGLQHY